MGRMTAITKRRQRAVPFALLSLLCTFAALTSCSTPRIDLASWRQRTEHARVASERGELAQDLALIETSRANDDLERARQLALALAAEHQDDAHVLAVASRAESDGLFLSAEDDKEARNHAAASALDYIERALARGETSIAAQAQLAWALGTTTHLQPMSARSAHARRTIETANAVLARADDDPVAHATLAMVNLRLSTLPWIARVMASDLPPASLDAARAHAERAVHALPSRENVLILAKILIARDERDAARAQIEQALAQAPRHPRDHAVESSLLALRAELRPR